MDFAGGIVIGTPNTGIDANNDDLIIRGNRIAKNGGLLPALRIARRALEAGLDLQLGCLVGETSLLSAAGLAFLQACPRVRFVEGAFGRFLLRQHNEYLSLAIHL